jgi:hypothetical protein
MIDLFLSTRLNDTSKLLNSESSIEGTHGVALIGLPSPN